MTVSKRAGIVLGLILGSTHSAGAALTDTQKCAIDTSKAWSDLGRCRASSDVQYIKLGNVGVRDAARSACERKFLRVYERARSRYGSACQQTEASGVLQGIAEECSTIVQTVVSGAQRSRDVSWSHAALPSGRVNLTLAEVGDRLYAIGGVDGAVLSTAEEFISEQSEWIPRASVPIPIAGSAGAVIEGQVFLFGGVSAGAQILAAVLVYDAGSDSWEFGPAMPRARQDAAAVVVGSSVYVIGGYNITEGYLDSVDVFDVETGQWSSGPALQTARTNLGAAYLGGKVYAVGGAASGGALGSTEVLDITAGTWVSGPSLESPRTALGVVELRGWIYAIGGSHPSGVPVSRVVERLGPTQEKWVPRAGLATPRSEFGAATVGDAILIVGGTAFVDYPRVSEEYFPSE